MDGGGEVVEPRYPPPATPRGAVMIHSLMFESPKILIFLVYTQVEQKQRHLFVEAKRKLHILKNRYKGIHPANLRVLFQSGNTVGRSAHTLIEGRFPSEDGCQNDTVGTALTGIDRARANL
ncbi:hypothetical protein NDU88_004339 [Pleurodeles waltl]|uniref:Uncharacterized protein n=1 Tax=Pleurodeles waltl TaxID=8319 RepID=A0AAV7PCN6_PLEWA|nr:hypothetical protein NDU88_004339 [Pleurodeles waltl]